MKTRRLWLSTLAGAALVSFVSCSSNDNHDVTVTWSDVKQPIDGFGASAVFFGGSITDEMADSLFDAKKGIGLSLLRIQIGLPTDIQSDGSEPPNANPMATAPEIATAKQALARGAKVWAAAWSPPPVWKTTNNKNGSGTGFTSNKLEPSHYQDYANYLAGFMQLTASQNVPIFALSPTNEPDYLATWDNAQWTPAELTTFIGQNLGPTFAQSAPAVKLISPETANCPGCDPYVTAILADPMAASYVPVIAVHGYTGNGALAYDKPQKAGKAFWQTEWSQENKNGDTPDPTMKSAIDMANHIHDYMVTTGVNAWNWWAIYHSADSLNDPQRMNPALIQPDLQPDASLSAPYMFKRGYALGNWAKFVRPGFVRIGATDRPVGGVLVEAYRDATHLAIIAVNTTSGAVNQTFHLAGGTLGTVTPWVTSADDPLVAKSPISATDQFTFDLPAMSVVTFVNWDATTETPGQPPVVTTDGGTTEAGAGDGGGGDGGIFASPCTASAAGITLIDNGSAGMGTTISFSPPFTPAGCGAVGSWGNFATNSGTIAPEPFVFSPLPPGIPADAGASTNDATVAPTGPQAACMTGVTGLPQYSTSGIGFNFVQQTAPAAPDGGGDIDGGAIEGGDIDGAANEGGDIDGGATEGGDIEGGAIDGGEAGPPPPPPSSGPATLDASSHTGIQFWAWGGSEIATQNILVVLRDINQTFGFGPPGTKTATGMLCNGGSDGVGNGPTACGGDRTSQSLVPGWQLVSIPFKSFVPISGYSSGNGETTLDPSTLTRFELQVQLSAAMADAGVPYDLCIYGLSFY
jgi:glucuronoarabinoxylan endo-1,4-beta-xylanase